MALKFSKALGDVFVDYSKNIITAETLKLLVDLAKECKLTEAKIY